jgi:DNA polymerase-3 subunit epsilon
MIRRCLIVDTETTGLDPKTDNLIEIGAILYDVKNQCSLVSFSTLRNASLNAAESINRIPAAALCDFYDSNPVGELDVFTPLIADAEVIVAHNADFDRSWLDDPWLDRPWLCTREDFTWPRQTKPGQSLVTLALDHGIGVASAHRALTDCRLIARLFDQMPDLQAMFARAMRPKALFRALVSYDDREKAKAAGFQWDAATKQWSRRMAIEDAAALPFKTVQVQS